MIYRYLGSQDRVSLSLKHMAHLPLNSKALLYRRIEGRLYRHRAGHLCRHIWGYLARHREDRQYPHIEDPVGDQRNDIKKGRGDVGVVVV